MERVRVARGEVGDGVQAPDSADDPVAALQELTRELTAEAAADAGDEPCAWWHRSSFRAGRRPSRIHAFITSSMTASAFNVRG